MIAYPAAAFVTGAPVAWHPDLHANGIPVAVAAAPVVSVVGASVTIAIMVTIIAVMGAMGDFDRNRRPVMPMVIGAVDDLADDQATDEAADCGDTLGIRFGGSRGDDEGGDAEQGEQCDVFHSSSKVGFALGTNLVAKIFTPK
jgi:hypothetical protein